MPKLYNKKYSKSELIKHIGRLHQIAGVEEIALSGGRRAGNRALQFRTGSGFDFRVLPDRGMDISLASFKGASLCWMSSCGESAPQFYESQGTGWLRSFYGGLLTTCGLCNVGVPCEDEGESFGLHGRISNLPAEEVAFGHEWEKDECYLYGEGKIRETSVFGPNLLLHRWITSKVGESWIRIEDKIENQGFKTEPLLFLYHCNFGFPLMDKDTKLIAPSKKVFKRENLEEADGKNYSQFTSPVSGKEEEVFYHDMEPDENGFVTVKIINDSFNKGSGLGVYLRYNAKTLPRFIQWKMSGEGTYVLGLEPSNTWVGGRSAEKERNNIKHIKPGQAIKYELEIGILE